MVVVGVFLSRFGLFLGFLDLALAFSPGRCLLLGELAESLGVPAAHQGLLVTHLLVLRVVRDRRDNLLDRGPPRVYADHTDYVSLCSIH